MYCSTSRSLERSELKHCKSVTKISDTIMESHEQLLYTLSKRSLTQTGTSFTNLQPLLREKHMKSEEGRQVVVIQSSMSVAAFLVQPCAI